MNIVDLMTKKPIMIDKEATVLEAIKKMQHYGCGILPVGDYQHVVGVITDRDIMVRAIAKGMDVNKTPIADVMSKEVVFCREDNSLQQAVDQMSRENQRRVLIQDVDCILTGVLSLGDIIRRVSDKALLANLSY